MNYETYTKEGQYLKTILKLSKLTREERIQHKETLKIVLMDIFTWPSLINEILKHDKNTFKTNFLCLWQWNFPKRFYRIPPHFHSQYTLKTKKTHTSNTLDTQSINTHQYRWYYFDMYHQSFLLFNSLKKNQSYVTHTKHLNIFTSLPTHNPTCIHV